MFAAFMFWLVVLEEILPQKCMMNLHEICDASFCTREVLVESLKVVPPHEVIAQFNRSLSLDVRKLGFAERCQQVAKASSGWALKGFPGHERKNEWKLVKHMYGVIMELLLHVPMKKFKASCCLWRLACTLSHVLIA